jgi:hypothetical protein
MMRHLSHCTHTTLPSFSILSNTAADDFQYLGHLKALFQLHRLWCVEWKMTVNDKLKRTRREVVTAYFKVLPQHLSGCTTENHKNLRQLVFRPRLEHGTF